MWGTEEAWQLSLEPSPRESMAQYIAIVSLVCSGSPSLCWSPALYNPVLLVPLQLQLQLQLQFQHQLHTVPGEAARSFRSIMRDPHSDENWEESDEAEGNDNDS